MIYLRKTTDIQEIWIPRLTPEKAEKRTCYENGYEDGYRDGVNTMDLQEKSVTSSTETTEVLPDDGYTGMTRVTVNSKPYGDSKYQEGYSSGSTDGYETGRKDGFEEGYGSGHTEGYTEGEEAGKDEILGGIKPVSVTVTADTMTVSPGDDEYGFSRVDVNAAGYGNDRYQEGYSSGHTDGTGEGREQVIASLQDKDVEMTESRMTVLPDGDAPGLSRVDIDAFPYGQSMYQSGWTEGETGGRREMEEYVADNSVELSVTANGEYNAAIDGGAGYIRKVDVNVPTGSTIENQEKTVTITANTSTTVTYDEGYTGLESVDIQVNVPTGETIHNQTKSVTVTGNTQSVTYDSGYTGLESVEIDAADFGDDRYQDGYAGGHAEGYSEGYSSGETDGRNEIISGLEETAVTVTADTMTISPAEGEHGFSRVNVNAAGYGNERYQEGYESGSTDGKNEIMQGLEATAVTVTASTMLVSPGAGKYGFSEVSIDSAEYGQSNYQSGYTEGYESGNTAGYQSGHTEGYTEGQEAGKSEILGGIDATAVTVTADTMSITPAEGKYGFSKVDIDSTEYGNTKYQEGYEEGDAAGYNEGYSAGSDDTLEEVASGSVEVTYTQNGAYDAEIDGTDGYIRKVTVNVPTGDTINNQSKSLEITANTAVTIGYDEGYTGLESVDLTVNVQEIMSIIDMEKYPELRFSNSKFSEFPTYIKIGNVTVLDNFVRDCPNLTEIHFNNGEISQATNLESFIQGCSKLKSFSADVSEALTIRSFAYSCGSLSSITLTNTNKITNFSNAFSLCYALAELDINTDNGENFSGMFTFCRGLTTVHLTSLAKVKSNYNTNNLFAQCKALVNLTIDVLPDEDLKDIRLSEAPLLSHDSIVGLLNTLPVTTHGYSFQLGSTNIAKLTDDEKAIATNKGWKLI